MTDSLGRSWQLGHRAARLLDARALRPRLHRRRQRRAPPGDDPPRAARLLRALHRHPASSTTPASCRSGWRRCRRSCCRSPTATSTRPPSVARRAARGRAARRSSTTARESVGRKIREAELRKVPYMLVVGDREAEQGTVSVRRAARGRRGSASGGRARRPPRRPGGPARKVDLRAAAAGSGGVASTRCLRSPWRAGSRVHVAAAPFARLRGLAGLEDLPARARAAAPADPLGAHVRHAVRARSRLADDATERSSRSKVRSARGATRWPAARAPWSRSGRAGVLGSSRPGSKLHSDVDSVLD